MSKYYSIHEFSKIIGVSAQTLRNWDSNGKLHPHHTTTSGYLSLIHIYLKLRLKEFLNADLEIESRKGEGCRQTRHIPWEETEDENYSDR